jgi:ABC-type dipeptide/oligopeptide/nickel transport system permease subunit
MIKLVLDRVALFSGTFVALLALLAIFAELFVSEAPIVLYANQKLYVLPELTAPSVARQLSYRAAEADFVIWPLVQAAPAASGTPPSAGQVFAETVRGTRRLVLATLSVLILSAAAGITLGALASMGPRILDAALARVVELGGALPSVILLALFLKLDHGPGLLSFVLLVAALRSLEIARLVRGELNKLERMKYVRAARALGLPRADIFRRHVLPHAAAPVLVSLSFTATLVAGLETTLWFVGLMPSPDTPSWGRMLAQPHAGRAVALVAIVLTTGALYALSERLFAHVRTSKTCDARQSE